MIALASALMNLYLTNADIEQVDIVACENGVDAMVYWYAPCREGTKLVDGGAVGVEFD